MKIKCIKNNISQIEEDKFLFNNLTFMEYHQDGKVPLLDVGNFYIVYAIVLNAMTLGKNLNKYPKQKVNNDK